jgi:hypothetical protein
MQKNNITASFFIQPDRLYFLPDKKIIYTVINKFIVLDIKFLKTFSFVTTPKKCYNQGYFIIYGIFITDNFTADKNGIAIL